MRGIIHSRERLRQIHNLQGLQWGRITPSDYDWLENVFAVDFKADFFIFYEGKYMDNDLSNGQRYHIEGLTNNMLKAGNKAVYIVYTHDIHDANEDVIVKDCLVKKFYDGYKWQYCNEDITVFDFSNYWIKNEFNME